MPAALTNAQLVPARVASSSDAFLPTQLANCRLWLAADHIFGLTHGDPIATWADLSGNDNHATQNTGARKPTWQAGQLNGRPVVRFDGVDDLLKNTSPTGLQLGATSATIFVVGKTVDAATRQRAYNFESTEPDYKGLYNLEVTAANKLQSLTDTGAAAVVLTSSASVGTGYGVLSVQLEYNGTGRTFINGTPDAAAASHTTDISGANLGFGIGAEWDGSSSYDPWNGDIAELIVFSRALSSAERSLVLRYCGRKYGLAVAA